MSVEEDSPFLSAFGVDNPGAKSTSGSSTSVTPEIAAYLTQLSSFGLERLTREPERLAEERTAILEQTKELASHNYKTFIKTADCSKEIFEDFVDVENRLGNLLEQKLPLCSTSCKDFQTQAEQISQKRKLNNQILQKHSQLLEILEIPQLIDTCVKNGHFDEALELANYIRRMERKHGNQIPLVRSILLEVRNCIQSMIGQLISQLRTAQLTLPVCLKVIGHIRRLDAFSETELRVLFLNARDSWFQSTLTSIPTDDAYNHVIKTIDATRVHLFDIVTQYKAIFTDDTEVRSNAKRTANGVASFHSNDSSILYSWILEKVEVFLSTLKTDLESPSVGQRLDAIFNQCMYFGLSFGRVGIDLRPLFIPIFEETSLRFLTDGLIRALKSFEEDLKLLSFTSSNVGTTGVNSLLAMSFDLNDEASASSSNVPGAGVGGANQPPPPPLALLEFPPLASLYNDILNGLNDFRPTATITLLFPTKDALTAHLVATARVCVAVFDNLKNSFTEGEVENFQRLCLLFVESLMPNVAKCFKCLFPSQRVAEAVGVGIGEIHKSSCYSLDKESVRNVFDKNAFPALAALEAEEKATAAAVKSMEEEEGTFTSSSPPLPPITTVDEEGSGENGASMDKEMDENRSPLEIASSDSRLVDELAGVDPKTRAAVEVEIPFVVESETASAVDFETPTVIDPVIPPELELKPLSVVEPESPPVMKPEIPAVVELVTAHAVESETATGADPKIPSELETPFSVVEVESSVVEETETPAVVEYITPTLVDPDTSALVKNEALAVEDLVTDKTPGIVLTPIMVKSEMLALVAPKVVTGIESKFPSLIEPLKPAQEMPEILAVVKPETSPGEVSKTHPDTSVEPEMEAAKDAQAVPDMMETDMRAVKEPETPVVLKPKMETEAEPEKAASVEPVSVAVVESEVSTLVEPKTLDVIEPEKTTEVSSMLELETPTLVESKMEARAEPETATVNEPEAAAVVDPKTAAGMETEPAAVMELDTEAMEDP